jgi:outer membrane efflux protein
LIDRALKANPDLKAAQAALLVARENVLAQRGAYYPVLSDLTFQLGNRVWTPRIDRFGVLGCYDRPVRGDDKYIRLNFTLRSAKSIDAILNPAERKKQFPSARQGALVNSDQAAN